MPTNQTYLRPNTIEEALRCADQHQDDFSYLAGGTDVWVNRRQGTNQTGGLVDISQLEELREIAIEDQTLRIGALVTLEALKSIPEIKSNFPVLIESAAAVGSPLIRKTGTVGGNILCENRCIFFNQSTFWREAASYCLKSGGDACIATGGRKACFSRFVSDLAPALICLDARVEIVDTAGPRVPKLEDIYTGDGMAPRNLSKTAILKSILLPLNRDFRAVFNKLRPRNSMDFTCLTTAVSVNEQGRLKIAIGGMSPRPVVIEAASGADGESVIKEALKLCKTVDNDAYSRVYRRKMLGVFLTKSFEELL
jgi:4-hydroxybenzoyl-CoA reductase subunit beta